MHILFDYIQLLWLRYICIIVSEFRLWDRTRDRTDSRCPTDHWRLSQLCHRDINKKLMFHSPWPSLSKSDELSSFLPILRIFSRNMYIYYIHIRHTDMLLYLCYLLLLSLDPLCKLNWYLVISLSLYSSWLLSILSICLPKYQVDTRLLLSLTVIVWSFGHSPNVRARGRNRRPWSTLFRQNWLVVHSVCKPTIHSLHISTLKAGSI